MDKSRGETVGLVECLESVPDWRDGHGKRHPLAAILALSVVAMAAGCRSLYAIWQWGRALSQEQARALGFGRGRTPAVSTLHEVFKRLDVEAFERALSQWAREQGAEQQVVAIDGKGLRGLHGGEVAGVRLVAAYSDRAGLVLAQEGGEGQNVGG